MKGSQHSPTFLPMYVLAKRSPILATAEVLLYNAVERLKCAGSVANFNFSTACSFVHWQHKGTKASCNVDADTSSCNSHRAIKLFTNYLTKIVSDIAVFVLKRDVKLQPTNFLSGSCNWNKTMQNKSKTNLKQNRIVLFWVCFSASYMWNKTRKQNKSRRGLSVNQSNNVAQQHCCLVNITTWFLTATHHVYESCFFIPVNVGVDTRDIKFSNVVILSYIVASKKSIKIFYCHSIESFSRNSVLPSLSIFI